MRSLSTLRFLRELHSPVLMSSALHVISKGGYNNVKYGRDVEFLLDFTQHCIKWCMIQLIVEIPNQQFRHRIGLSFMFQNLHLDLTRTINLESPNKFN